jgi:hypothetical protein
MTAGLVGSGLRLSERPVSMRETVMNQQAMRRAARRSALDAQAVRRKERADRERRLEGLAVAVLTALGEGDGAVRDAERRAGEALRTMTGEEGLSVAPGSRVVRQGRHGSGSEPAAPPGARGARWRQLMSRRLVSGAVSPRRTGRERPGDRGTAQSKVVQLPRSECSSWTSAVSRPGASFQHSNLDYPVQHTYPGNAQPPPVRVAAGRDLLPHRLS